MKKLLNKKGFTLIEMLIVVAIMVILVAVAVPTFSGSLNDAKVAVDAANLDAAESQAIATYMKELNSTTKTVVDNCYYDIKEKKFVSEAPAAYGESSDNKGKVIQIQVDEENDTVKASWQTPVAGSGSNTNSESESGSNS